MTVLQTYWQWSPILLGILILVIGFYGYYTKFRPIAKSIPFVTGILLVFVAVSYPTGPPHAAPLFSLHMGKHIILLMLTPPLLVAALSTSTTRSLFERATIKKIRPMLLNPFFTWCLGVGSMWFWHIPVLYNISVAPNHIAVHIIETLSLITVGILFCWPILSPVKRHRLSPLKGIIYLFSACFGCSILGIIIAFASPGMYHTPFVDASRPIWGLTQAVDQQLGGLLMWVPGCFIYLTGVVLLLVRWFSDTEVTTSNRSLNV